MLLATLVGDRAAFESMFRWTEANLARQDVALYIWRYDPQAANPVSDMNNATDGDILIAWAMARAGAKWGVKAWEDRSAQIRAAIRNRLVVDRFGGHFLLPGLQGFDNGQSGVTLSPPISSGPRWTCSRGWTARAHGVR
jgi:endoglucanase